MDTLNNISEFIKPKWSVTGFIDMKGLGEHKM